MSSGRRTAAAIAAGVTAVAALALAPISQASAPARATPRSAANGAVGAFSSLNGPGDNVTSLVFVDDTLYAGSFSGATPGSDDSFIQGWSGSAWRQVGGGIAGTGGSNWVAALATIDDTLYAAGPFPGARGIAGTRNIAAFAGGAWRSMKSWDDTATDGVVAELATMDDTLYAAGQFTTIGGVATNYVAQWADDTWRPLGTGLTIGTNPVLAAGADTLYAAGAFNSAGGVANTSRIAKWSGNAWHALGSGVDDTTSVSALAVQGDTLYAGGDLYLRGGTSTEMRYVAAWANGAWHPLGSGLPRPANALAVDDAHGLVYAGGPFPNPMAADDTLIAQVFDLATSEWIPLDDDTTTSPFTFYGGTVTSAIAPDDSVVYLGVGGMEWNAWPNGRVFKWTWEAPSASLSVTSGTAGSGVPITGWSLIGVDSVTFGTTAAAISRDDSTSLTATVPNLAPGTYTVTVSAVGGTTTAGTYTVTSPPTPQTPGAPTSVNAEAGDTTATVTWQAPANPGTYPVTNYQVESVPGGESCLTPALTCTVAGLTNGTSYTFRARALSGAGWGPWSSPSNSVTPSADPTPTTSIQITGTRTATKATVAGTTIGFGMGGMVTAHIRLARGVPYSQGSTVLVSTGGTFDWSRGVSTRKTLWVYFTGGDVKSNVLRLSP